MSNTHSLYTCSIMYKLWEHLVFWKFQQIQLYSIFQMCPLTCGACVSYHTLSLFPPSFPFSLPPSLHVSELHSFEYPLYLNAVNISSNHKIKSQTINKMGRDFKPRLKIQIVRQLFYVYNIPGALGSSLLRTVHEKAMLHLNYSTWVKATTQ